MKTKSFVLSKLIGLSTIASFLLVFTGGCSMGANKNVWDKTFPKSDKVDHQKVTYRNRYGINISADMYLPKNLGDKKLPALVIGTPYGGVKEQGAGIYAQTLAERGFVTIAFDESFNGESGGEPRHTSSPAIFSEDFSAGADFLGTRPFVDREKIGAIGICGSSAFALKAAQVDKRIKAIATASMYDMSRVNRYGWMDQGTKDARDKTLEALSLQRYEDFENGTPKFVPTFPTLETQIPESLDPISSEFFEYYAMKRGYHPRAIAAFTNISVMDFINFPLLDNIKDISPRPILFIMGEKAHSRYFTEDAYKAASQPKELLTIPNARHIDLYDRTDMIPFDKLESFFKENLK